MPKIPDTIKKFGNILGKGFIQDMAPGIAAGYLVDMLQRYNVGVKEATKWVQDNISLWDKLKPEEQQSLRELSDRIGNRVEWITAEWAIDAVKGDLPALASLFLGWRKANNWLVRQAEIIRGELSG